MLCLGKICSTFDTSADILNSLYRYSNMKTVMRDYCELLHCATITPRGVGVHIVISRIEFSMGTQRHWCATQCYEIYEQLFLSANNCWPWQYMALSIQVKIAFIHIEIADANARNVQIDWPDLSIKHKEWQCVLYYSGTHILCARFRWRKLSV